MHVSCCAAFVISLIKFHSHLASVNFFMTDLFLTKQLRNSGLTGKESKF